MLLGLSWLRQWTPFEGTAEELADRLTMLGLEVEDIRDPFAHLTSVVTGRVVECVPHPASDHLSVCRVDVGGAEFLPIVCGAPNVAAGQMVPVATVGTTLPGGMTIQKAKLRGERSWGMICSERELGLGESHGGIMVLDPKLSPGVPVPDALGLERVVLDVSITPNRADCLSVLGLARETAAAFGLPLHLPQVQLTEAGEPWSFAVEAEADACPLYQARLIRSLSVAPSPDWMRYRLLACGMRPRNNLVDVTNYVLLETGQPLHAFDADRLHGGRIRAARTPQPLDFTTLDGQVRRMEPGDILIWDAQGPVAVAGVMGGQDSEVTDTTTNVLLESAVFHSLSVRRTARRLGIASEAAYRFERGVDQLATTWALDRAASLMAELAGGVVAPGVAGAEPVPYVPRSVSFRPRRVFQVLGVDPGEEFAHKTLVSLGCAVTSREDAWEVTLPSFRLDLEREIDLVEEVARFYGMDRIPAVLPPVSLSLDALAQADTSFAETAAVKAWGKGAGLLEAVNYSFVSAADIKRCGLPLEHAVRVANPLSEDMEVLRTDLVPGMLRALRHNIAGGTTRVRLFEVARIFVSDAQRETTVAEALRLAILLHGARFAERAPYPRGEVAFADIKGLVEHLLVHLGLGPCRWLVEQARPYLAEQATAWVDGRSIGAVGRIAPSIADAYEARGAVWYADLDLERLLAMARQARLRFTPLGRFPVVRRDVTLRMGWDISVDQVLGAVAAMQEPLVDEHFVLDVYHPQDAAVRHVTVRVVYRHPERTLKDKEVDKVHSRLVSRIVQQLPVQVV